MHERRAALLEKNLLAVGEVTVAGVIALLKRCRGGEYIESPHHLERDVLVHEFRPGSESSRWYIKGYFEGGGLILISVHRSERER